MNRFVAALIATLASLTAFAQLPPQSSLREVRDRTIISNELPKADFTFSKEFRYVGGQRINLYGRCEAEQHMFVKAGSNGIVERFYWVSHRARDTLIGRASHELKCLADGLIGHDVEIGRLLELDSQCLLERAVFFVLEVPMKYLPWLVCLRASSTLVLFLVLSDGTPGDRFQ